jgi:hypothetical protein
MKKAMIVLIPVALAAVLVWVFFFGGKGEQQRMKGEGGGMNSFSFELSETGKKGGGMEKKVIPDQFVGRKKHRLKIVMEAPIDSKEREERFEKPLEKALGDMGQIDGGGSMTGEVDGKYIVARCEIEVSVDDLEKGKVIVWQVLKEAGAPEGTRVEAVE